MSNSVLDELEARGLIQECSDREELGKLLASETVTFYSGYDPTGQSLHAGNLVPLRVMAALARAGHKMIAVVGGATGMIGDPSGRASERTLLDEHALAQNLTALRAQIERFVAKDATILDNRAWSGMSFLEFLRDVGKHITVNYMLAKESVHARLNDREQGISYTEFSYMLLQAHDFAWLARNHGVRLQIGGADQWGNITAGIELSRKMGNEQRVFGLVSPLLLTASGEKFGKSTGGGRVWLDARMTSPYRFYQYWLNTSDADVEKHLKMFSFIPLDEIARTMEQHRESPPARLAQRRLAVDVTTWVHGDAASERAGRASRIMFGDQMDALHDDDFQTLLEDLPSTEVPRSELQSGIPLPDLLTRTRLAQSKGAARRLIEQGGAYINNVRQSEPARTVTTADLATEQFMLLRAGKKDWHILRVV